MNPIRIPFPQELFDPAQCMHVQGEDVFDELTIGPDTITFLDPVSWGADITNVGDSLLVRGSARANVQTNCARCLADMTLDLEGEIDALYLLHAEDALTTDLEEDEFEIMGEDHTIDLTGPITAALVLAFPRVLLCKEDCKGICPHCGADLNTEPCQCTQAPPEEDASNPFAVLKDLKLSD